MNIFNIWIQFNEKSLIDVFPNLYTTLKIYLTIPSTNYSAERAFSKLRRIKNKFRTSTKQYTSKFDYTFNIGARK